MPAPRIVFLMYHELELPGRPTCHPEPGYVRYVVAETAFRSHMNWLKQNQWQVLSVGEALRYPQGKSVALTFDDGSETDLIAGAPILKELEFNATFYITSGFLNQRGYMSSTQLRELGHLGFEIGCHSMTHPALNDCSDSELHRELVDARSQLQDITGTKIEHFSCPGGRYDQRTLKLANESGYRSLATSHIHANTPATDPYLLGRAVIMRGATDRTFQQVCTGEALAKMRMNEAVRDSARKLLGNRLYDRVRTRLLR